MALLLISSSCLSDQGAIVIVNVIVIVIEQDCSGDLALYHWNSVQRLQGRPVGQQVICIKPCFVFWKMVQLNKEMKRWLDNFLSKKLSATPSLKNNPQHLPKNNLKHLPHQSDHWLGGVQSTCDQRHQVEISIFFNHHLLHLFENLYTLIMTFQRCCHPWGWNSPS